MASVLYWRDVRVRVAAVACAVLEVLSLGSTQVIRGVTVLPVLLPWHWLAHLPVLTQMLPNRLSLLADGLAAAVLAISLSLALSAAGQPRWRRQVVPLTLVVIAVLPLVPLPLHTTQAAAVPPGYRAAFTRLALPRDARVLVVPVPYGSVCSRALVRADGIPGSMNGGYSRDQPDGRALTYGGRGPRAIARSVTRCGPSHRYKPPTAAQMRGYVARWKPAAVVAVTKRSSRLGRLLVTVLGPPSFTTGRVVVWRR